MRYIEPMDPTMKSAVHTQSPPFKRRIHESTLRSILSFGPQAPALELKSLNVLIGSNGSGKSNLIECLALLRAAPSKLGEPIRDGGGMMEWVYKGKNSGPTRLEVVIDTGSRLPLRHSLELGLEQARFVVVSEVAAFCKALPGKKKPYFFYEYENGTAILNKFDRPKERHLETKFVGDQQSILNVLKDPISYPELSYLAKAYTDQIRIYREWSMGRYGSHRMPQPADMSGDFLDEDFRNLGMVINQLEQDHPDTVSRMVEVLQTLYPSISGIGVQIVGGTQQVYLREDKMKIPATRLSDGTLRFLCLLTILLHPKPPQLICLEEPELGLHPDVIGTLAELLVEASERTQLIVTTHSVRLIDGLTEHPESVVVCEKDEDGTRMKRLSANDLEPWLAEYRLGKLWTRGDLGGNRW